ncbi:hypothetical protein E2C01_067799 [Portunus trituberculatus]|uniref:Uncharacterized protein n=1 Tax=Portunus trituberculatus TaxID=210409 RepID=A0A5B7HUN1_PORTR|nr:hypothetical protein [Portunus trituberculatus]
MSLNKSLAFPARHEQRASSQEAGTRERVKMLPHNADALPGSGRVCGDQRPFREWRRPDTGPWWRWGGRRVGSQEERGRGRVVEQHRLQCTILLSSGLAWAAPEARSRGKERPAAVRHHEHNLVFHLTVASRPLSGGDKSLQETGGLCSRHILPRKTSEGPPPPPTTALTPALLRQHEPCVTLRHANTATTPPHLPTASLSLSLSLS